MFKKPWPLLPIALLTSVSLVASAWPQTGSITAVDSAALRAASEILNSVSHLRRLPIKSEVKSGLKNRDQIEEAIIRDLDESNTPQEFDAATKALIKFGLVPKNFELRSYLVKLLREQVAGFYEPKSREFYLAAWLPISEQKTVMAHELTHALQDQHFNLRRFEDWPRGDSDAELAAHALVEGDATVVMLQFGVDQEGVKFDVTRVDSLTALLLLQNSGDDRSRYPVLSAAPTVLRESLQFPYVYGAGFVQEVLKNGSWEALDKAYNALPASTEHIIHPERFLNSDRPIKIDLPDVGAVLGKGWKRLDSDVNGEFGYRIALGEFVSSTGANQAAAGWGGDRFCLFENATTGALFLGQFTTWDTEKDAAEFFEAYCERTEKRYLVTRSAKPLARSFETDEGHVSIELRGRDVVIVEGAANARQLARLSSIMWRSKKSSR